MAKHLLPIGAELLSMFNYLFRPNELTEYRPPRFFQANGRLTFWSLSSPAIPRFISSFVICLNHHVSYSGS